MGIVGEGAGLVVVAVLLAGGGDGPEEVIAGGVSGDSVYGIGLDGLEETAVGGVLQGLADETPRQAA